jgi:tetratricopeptide (TPR) repeat protein
MQPGRSGIFMPENTRLSARVQQNTNSEETSIFGLESVGNERTLFNQASTVTDTGATGSVAQYGPLAQSRLMLESRFPTNVLSSRNREQSKPTQIRVNRQDRTSSAELFIEQVQDAANTTHESDTDPGLGRGSLWEKDERFQLPSQKTNIRDLTPQFEMQTSGQNPDEDVKRNAFHQGSSALEKFTPSMDSVSRKNLFLESTNGYITNSEYQTAQEQIPMGDQEQNDVLERIRQQLEDLTESIDAAIQSSGANKDVSTDPVTKREKNTLGYQRQTVFSDWINSNGSLNYYRPQKAEPGFSGEEPFEAGGRRLSRTRVGEQTGLEFMGIPKYKNAQERSSPLNELNRLSQKEISAEASQIIGSHNSLKSLSQSKFNQHMRNAQEHLRAGRYYRAASCYSLASVYQPDSPLALAGRGHALFAAGEYVSSALFLSRALAISPEYLQTRIDLAAMFDDRNKLAGRIEDIEQWLARSGSSQLQFLLGYVYYRTGQLLRAKNLIDAAYEKTPESPAVQAIKIIVDSMTIQR